MVMLYLMTGQDDAAKVIIDSEVSSLLKKSGVGTRDQGISTIAGYEQYKKLKTFNQDIWNVCVNDIYNYSGLVDSNNKHHYCTRSKSTISIKWEMGLHYE